jgi:hypothetical protein
MSALYAFITNCTNVLAVNIQSSHSSQVATANFEVEDTSLIVGNEIQIDLGYEDNHQIIFTGYVKSVDRKEPEMTYQILASDKLVRAAEYFIASTNPKTPFSRNNIYLEDLVSELLTMASVTLVDYDPTYFTIGVSSPVEVNLTTVLDYCRYLGDIVTWSLWSDETGNVYFKNRKPYVMGEDISIGTLNKYTSNIVATTNAKATQDGTNLRNKIVIYGSGSIYAEASASSPYLPDGFYKTVVIWCAQLFVAQEMAQMAADYNLEALNRITEGMSLVAVGNPDYLARKVITANFPEIGVNSTDYYIFAAEQNWGSQGYTVNLELRK